MRDTNLVVTKTASNENPLPGETVTYTVTVTNNTGMVLKNVYPKDMADERLTDATTR